MAIKKILSPVDFSDVGAAALQTAANLAHDTGAELLLLHVIHEPAFSFPEGGYATPRIIEEYETAMKRKLAELAAGVRSGVTVDAKIVRGIPYQAIVDAIEKERADLVVMGTHGRTGINHWLLGSVAERVVRTSRVPVMTVRAP